MYIQLPIVLLVNLAHLDFNPEFPSLTRSPSHSLLPSYWLFIKAKQLHVFTVCSNIPQQTTFEEALVGSQHGARGDSTQLQATKSSEKYNSITSTCASSYNELRLCSFAYWEKTASQYGLKDSCHRFPYEQH